MKSTIRSLQAVQSRFLLQFIFKARLELFKTARPLQRF